MSILYLGVFVGFKVGLQIERLYLTAWEVAYSAFSTGLYDFGRNITTKKVLPLLIKLQANVSYENALYMPLGYELAILMEAGLAGYEMYKSALLINLQYASFRSTLSILCMYIALRVLTFPLSIITLGNALVFKNVI